MPPSDDLRAERQRRKNFTAAVLTLFKSKPNEWIDASLLALFGGLLAWRTRVADARKAVTAEGGAIENRQRRTIAVGADGQKHVTGPVISEYRYTPKSADVPVPDRWPVSEAPTQEPWRLT